MRFICLKCGRSEEVIGDKNPLCLYCNGPMKQAVRSYAGLWMSPEFVIRRMRTVVESFGFQGAEHGRFKKEREAWASGIYALALSETEGKQYWVEVETVAQTPDTYVHQIDQSKGRNTITSQSIEVVDWEEHTDNVMELIRKKCSRPYSPIFSLLVSGRSDKVIEPDALASEIVQLTVPSAQVWMVGVSDYNKAHASLLYPNFMVVQFDVQAAFQKARPVAEIIQKLQRGKSMEFVPLGAMYLPIPIDQ